MHLFLDEVQEYVSKPNRQQSPRVVQLSELNMTTKNMVDPPAKASPFPPSREQAAVSMRDRSAVGDARLVEEARRGDRDAFGELVTRYERRLIRVILRFVPDQEQARDLAQETFLRVYRRLDQFDSSRRFGPWLFRVGVNLTLDYLRKRKRRVKWSVFSDAAGERQPDPATPDPRQELDLSQEVRAVMEQLPEKYRSVLVLRDLENFTNSEIAAILNRKEATIRWRLAEARKQFKTLWVARMGESAAIGNLPAPAMDEIDERD